jgi:AraC-like DNA-binding protein
MRRVSDVDMTRIHRLVGPATRENLRAVECYVGNRLGVFIPSVGQCGYATTKDHTHPAWSFILYFLADDSHLPRTIEIPESFGLGVAIEPDLPHEESIVDDFYRYAAVMVEPAFFGRIWAVYSDLPPPECDWRQFAVHSDVFFYLKRFMNECDCAVPDETNGDVSPLAAALEEPIAHLLARGLAGEGGSKAAAAQGAISAEILRAVEHVERQYADQLSATALAAIAGLSVSAFSRRFHEEMGVSPAEYVIEARIRKAKIMLDDPSRSVTDVALACGFYDASHFSSCFLKHVGINPKRYAALFASRDRA